MSTSTVPAQGDQRTPEESEVELPAEDPGIIENYIYMWLSSLKLPPLNAPDAFVKLELHGLV